MLGAPAFDPGFHVGERNGLARALEGVEPAAVFRDVGIADVDDGVEQRVGRVSRFVRRSS